MSEKKQRILTLAEAMINNLQPLHRAMIQAFYPQFRAFLSEADEETIDSMIKKGYEILNFVEFGGGEHAEPKHD